MSEVKTLVPKLRFPEFRDAGEWEEGKLGDKEISEFIKDRIPLDQLDVGSYISTVNLLPDFAGIKTATKLPPSGSFTQFIKNDVLISNIRPYLKKVWQAQMDGSASNDVIVIRAKNKIIDNFLMCILKNDDFINYVMKDARGVKMPRGDISSIKKYPLCYPSGKEQQKIADCLSSIDELITAHSQKHEVLKVHKKGLMQQLFPATGETVPKLRFPEFRDAGEWGVRVLKSIAVIAMGSSPKSSSYNGEENGLPLLQGNADIKNRESVPRVFTSQITKECLIGDILLSVRAPVGTVAKSKHHACIGRGIAAIRAKEKKSHQYLYQWFLFFESKWQSISQGGTFEAVNSDDIKLLPVLIPKDLDEQQKIADCLSSIDDLITAQAQKIESLKTHKKGLMQQLFPATDEVSA